jgi:hypothetical protein
MPGWITPKGRQRRADLRLGVSEFRRPGEPHLPGNQAPRYDRDEHNRPDRVSDHPGLSDFFLFLHKDLPHKATINIQIRPLPFEAICNDGWAS